MMSILQVACWLMRRWHLNRCTAWWLLTQIKLHSSRSWWLFTHIQASQLTIDWITHWQRVLLCMELCTQQTCSNWLCAIRCDHVSSWAKRTDMLSVYTNQLISIDPTCSLELRTLFALPCWSNNSSQACYATSNDDALQAQQLFRAYDDRDRRNMSWSLVVHRTLCAFLNNSRHRWTPDSSKLQATECANLDTNLPSWLPGKNSCAIKALIV